MVTKFLLSTKFFYEISNLSPQVSLVETSMRINGQVGEHTRIQNISMTLQLMFRYDNNIALQNIALKHFEYSV